MYNVLLVSIMGIFDATAEIPFMFKRAGCKVDVFCASHAWLRCNRFHDKWIETSEDEQEFKTNLLNLVEKDPDHYDWIVLLDDATIKLMNDSIQSEELFKKILPILKSRIEKYSVLKLAYQLHAKNMESIHPNLLIIPKNTILNLFLKNYISRFY